VIITVDTASPTPPYEQIRGQLATMIESGTLTAGTQLPTIRQLAADLGLAANTVARAYRELEIEGLVASRVRHGTVVAARPAMTHREVQRRLDEAAHSYAALARRLGVDNEEAQARVRMALSNGTAKCEE
jgi:DNA-binding transcriptional regulator YhcF (GntR family)